MKKRLFSWGLLLPLFVMLLGSCSQQPEYAKLIPDDPALLVKVDAKQIYMKADAGKAWDEATANKVVGLMGGSAQFNKTMKELLKDPRTCGLDFDDPLLFAVNNLGKDSWTIFLATVDDEDKVTAVLNTLCKEKGLPQVQEKGDLHTLAMDNAQVCYDDDNFCIALSNFGTQSSDEISKEMAAVFDKGVKHNEETEKKLDAIFDSKGLVNWMVTGNLMQESVGREMALATGFDMSKLDLLMGLESAPGRLDFTYEVLSDDPAFNEYIQKSEAASGKIKGDLLPYITRDDAFAMAHYNGEAASELLKTNKMFLNILGNYKDDVLKGFATLNGDIAVGVRGIDIPSKSVDLVYLYGKTKDNSIIHTIASKAGDAFLPKAKDLYTLKMDSSRLANAGFLATNVMGYKDGISYYLLGKSGKDVPTAVSKPLSLDQVKGYKSYFWFPASMAIKMLTDSGLEPAVKEMALNYTKLFDGVEGYAAEPTKAVISFRFVDTKSEGWASLTRSLFAFGKHMLDGGWMNLIGATHPIYEEDMLEADSIEVMEDEAYMDSIDMAIADEGLSVE